MILHPCKYPMWWNRMWMKQIKKYYWHFSQYQSPQYPTISHKLHTICNWPKYFRKANLLLSYVAINPSPSFPSDTPTLNPTTPTKPSKIKSLLHVHTLHQRRGTGFHSPYHVDYLFISFKVHTKNVRLKKRSAAKSTWKGLMQIRTYERYLKQLLISCHGTNTSGSLLWRSSRRTCHGFGRVYVRFNRGRKCNPTTYTAPPVQSKEL